MIDHPLSSLWAEGEPSSETGSSCNTVVGLPGIRSLFVFPQVTVLMFSSPVYKMMIHISWHKWHVMSLICCRDFCHILQFCFRENQLVRCFPSHAAKNNRIFFTYAKSPETGTISKSLVLHLYAMNLEIK